MYENESAAVRLGIDFLTALNEKDYLLDLSFDPVDLERKLDEIQADVNVLISNLPVEAIDDDEEREMEYPGDFEDSEESGIPAVASNEVRVTYLDNQNILVEGLKAGSNVELFSLLGQLIEKKSTKDGEALQFKLPNDKGVYVLKVDNQSIKIVKK